MHRTAQRERFSWTLTFQYLSQEGEGRHVVTTISACHFQNEDPNLRHSCALAAWDAIWNLNAFEEELPVWTLSSSGSVWHFRGFRYPEDILRTDSKPLLVDRMYQQRAEEKSTRRLCFWFTRIFDAASCLVLNPDMLEANSQERWDPQKNTQGAMSSYPLPHQIESQLMVLLFPKSSRAMYCTC